MSGRPTKYKSEYCDAVIASGRAGETLCEFAASIDVTAETISHWQHKHPAFFQAVKKSTALSEAWYTKKVREMSLVSGSNSNITAMVWLGKNKC